MPSIKNVVQWNIRAFSEHIDELCYLLQAYTPLEVALQETKFPKGIARSQAGFNLRTQIDQCFAGVLKTCRYDP